VKLSSTSSLLEVHLVLFNCFSIACSVVIVVASLQPNTSIWFELFCQYRLVVCVVETCSFLVRLTVTNSFSPLSLLLLELLSPGFPCGDLTQQFAPTPLSWLIGRSPWSFLVQCSCRFIAYLESVPWLRPLVFVSITVAAPAGSLQLEHWPLVCSSGFVHSRCLP